MVRAVLAVAAVASLVLGGAHPGVGGVGMSGDGGMQHGIIEDVIWTIQQLITCGISCVPVEDVHAV